MFSSPGLSWLLLTMPYHTSYVSYPVYIEFHSSLLLGLLVFLIFPLLLFTTFHNHGPCCYLSFTPSFLPLQEFYKGERDARHVLPKPPYKHAVWKMSHKWWRKPVGEAKEAGNMLTPAATATVSTFYLQESSHFKMCSVRSERSNRVWITNTEAALLAIAKGHACVSVWCLSISLLVPLPIPLYNFWLILATASDYNKTRTRADYVLRGSHQASITGEGVHREVRRAGKLALRTWSIIVEKNL